MPPDAAAMREPPAHDMRALVDEVYRTESRRVFATLIRLLGDFDVAEDAMHDAFAAAVDQWTRDGVPANPRAWLVSTGRFKAIDALRRRTRFDQSMPDLAAKYPGTTSDVLEWDQESIEDDRLRLIFTCCHPALAPEARVALTLREVCGLTTEEIARSFLVPPSTLGAADRAGQGEDPRRGDSLPGARAGGVARAARDGAPGDLPRLQRRVFRVIG
jgi:RNA polymerase sigma-70 factor (ECF subfamily)